MKKLLWFGPAPIFVEWFGVIYLTLAYSFDTSLPISQFLTVDHPARAFSITLFIFAPLLYCLFAFGLASTWRWTPYIAIPSGIFFSLTALFPFVYRSFTLHDLTSFISVILYWLMILGIQINSNEIKTNQLTKFLTVFIALIIIGEIFTSAFAGVVYASHELLLLISIHAWTLIVFKEMMWPKDRIA